MSQPTPYTPSTDFSQQEANNASGRSTVNTAALDAEFAAIDITLDQTLANLQLLQRDDGRLKDTIVEIHTLDQGVLNLMGGWELKGAWLTATDYAVNDLVSAGEYTYVCHTAHTSGIAFVDTNWTRFGFAGSADAAIAAAQANASAASAATSASTATTGAGTATTKAAEASASSIAASNSAILSASSANSASISATSAANSAAAAASSSGVSHGDLASTSPTLGAALVGGIIADAVTLLVPSQYASISAALSYLASKTIARGVTATIQVADGTHSFSSTVSLNHPQGSQIRLLGNQTTPASCILDFGTSTVDGFIASNGNTFGYINGFTIRKNAKATVGKWNSADGLDDVDNSTGILANNGSTIICGTSIVVQNFYYGIAARSGSYVYSPKAVVSGGGDVNIWAFVGSTIDCPGATSSNAKDVSVTSTGTNAYGFGIQAEYGSTVNCSKYGSDVTTASGSYIAGIAALSNSTVRAHYAVASSNVGSGFLARDYGEIENHYATANTNTRYGEEYITGGFITGSGRTISGNTIAGNNGYAYFDNGSLGARIAANGDLRIDNNGASSTYFNTSGGLQFSITSTASAVNRVNVTGGATGVSPIISVYGETNTPLTLRGSGTGSVFIGSSAANYFRFNNASGGNSPGMFPEGSDTNLDFIIAGKGTGTVRFGSWTTSGDVAVNGYLTIKDYAGNTRKLATVA